MRERPDAETGEVAWDFIRSVWSSKSGLAIAPLQDLLNLGVEGRMNVPGVATGNWSWRCAEDLLKPSLFERLRDLTTSTGRIASANTELWLEAEAQGQRTLDHAGYNGQSASIARGTVTNAEPHDETPLYEYPNPSEIQKLNLT